MLFFICSTYRNIQTGRQYRHCTYGVKMRRVRQAIVAVEKKYRLHILRVFLLPYLSGTHSACALLHCHLCPIWLYSTFPHYVINGTNFDKAIDHKRRVLIVFTTLLRNISDSKKY